MNRRDFLKVVSALTGSAALPASVLASIPEEIPDKWFLSLHTADGSEYARQDISEAFDNYSLTQEARFPEANTPVELTHAVLVGPDTECEFKLYRRVPLTPGITPVFTAGALSITEE